MVVGHKQKPGGDRQACDATFPDLHRIRQESVPIWYIIMIGDPPSSEAYRKLTGSQPSATEQHPPPAVVCIVWCAACTIEERQESARMC